MCAQAWQGSYFDSVRASCWQHSCIELVGGRWGSGGAPGRCQDSLFRVFHTPVSLPIFIQQTFVKYLQEGPVVSQNRGGQGAVQPEKPHLAFLEAGVCLAPVVKTVL